MVALLEAVDVRVGDPCASPFSLGVAPGEIVGLLFPQSTPREPTLRTLAGLDVAVAGQVTFPAGGRVVFAPPERPLAEALAAGPDLVLIDAAARADGGLWAQLAKERDSGTSFVVATTSVDEACRGDRVALASWQREELREATRELARRMTSIVQEFLAVLGEARHRRTGALAADLRRLNIGARALLAEMQRTMRASEGQIALQQAREELAEVSLSDRLLESVIAGTKEP